MIARFLIASVFVTTFTAPPEQYVDRVASYYADKYEDRLMANGRPFRQRAMTCASNDWPLGTKLLIQFRDRAIKVEVTDRMHPRFTSQRVDLSKAAFRALSPLEPGIIGVRVTPLP
jgi:rare lipoprotein A